jgi:hypothetical protein
MCVKKSEGLTVVNSKIFSGAGRLFLFSPKGATLSFHALCWIFLNSLWRVLRKSALRMNEIAASNIRVIHCVSNKRINNENNQ